MKKDVFWLPVSIAVVGIAGCNGTNTSSNTQMNSGDSSVTTTTTVVHHKYSGNFIPNPATRYYDLQTRKNITVKIDTVRGTIVNSETDEPVPDLLVEPTTHDTIYGQTGTVVNNYITKDDGGNYRVDTVRINTADQAAAQPDVVDTIKDKEKIKIKRNGDEKIRSKTETVK